MRLVESADCISKLETLVERSHGTRLQKLRRAPKKLISAKLLILLCKSFGTTIQATTETFWGDHMTVVFPEGTSSQLFQYGFLDKELGLTRSILKHVKPGMVFFDVGAHYGFYTLLASVLVGPGGQVHAFEPTPDTYAVLRENACRRDNIQIHNLVVWSGETTLSLNDFGPRFSGYNSLYEPRLPGIKARTAARKHLVRAVSLDHYVRRTASWPDFIKIDAESAEEHVLHGMENLLDRCQPIVSVEVGDLYVDGVCPSRDLLQFLMNKGYTAFELENFPRDRHRLKDLYPPGNILFLPENPEKP